LLAVEANRLGETVDVYISRAVAVRLMDQLERRADPSQDDYRDAFEREGLMPPFPSEHGQLALHDPARLRSLADTGVLDTAASDFFDRVVALAAEALGVPAAAIAVVEHDQQIYWASIGMQTVGVHSQQVPLERSIAQYIVGSGKPLIVSDARSDPHLKNHPTVLDGPLRAYLGFPLTNSAGHTIGALSVGDTKPHHWGLAHIEILEVFAAKVSNRIFASDGSPR
jgi:signal transduction protein with GAF and PtsI domain